jgi:hypothetical protein
VTIQTIEDAVDEAERFLVRAHDVLIAHPGTTVSRDVHLCAAKENGALRRASMDLSRALADMRRSE